MRRRALVLASAKERLRRAARGYGQNTEELMRAVALPSSARRSAHQTTPASLTAMQARYLEGSRRTARIMDSKWGIGPLRFGADAIVGLIPVVGDIVSASVSLYLLWVGVQLRLPTGKMVRMGINAALDLLFGLVPIAGDAADMLFRSHARNQRIIEQHVLKLARDGEGRRRGR
jgi:hypothetical protein